MVEKRGLIARTEPPERAPHEVGDRPVRADAALRAEAPKVTIERVDPAKLRLGVGDAPHEGVREQRLLLVEDEVGPRMPREEDHRQKAVRDEREPERGSVAEEVVVDPLPEREDELRLLFRNLRHVRRRSLRSERRRRRRGLRAVRPTGSLRAIRSRGSPRAVRGTASLHAVRGPDGLRAVRGAASLRAVRGTASLRAVRPTASLRAVRRTSLRAVRRTGSLRAVRGRDSLRFAERRHHRLPAERRRRALRAQRRRAGSVHPARARCGVARRLAGRILREPSLVVLGLGRHDPSPVYFPSSATMAGGGGGSSSGMTQLSPHS